MKAEELMIGDWVIVHRIECVGDGGQFQEWKQIGYITRINEDTVYVMFDKQKEDWEEIDVKDIEPILLTPEILEKNGFIKSPMVSDTPPYDKDEEGNIHFSLNEKFWGWWQPNNTFLIPANGLGWIEFKYVHELQHALILCGISKEIIL